MEGSGQRVGVPFGLEEDSRVVIKLQREHLPCPSTFPSHCLGALRQDEVPDTAKETEAWPG